MKNIRIQSLVWVGLFLLFLLNIGLVLAAFITTIIWFIVMAIILSLIQFVLHDLFRRKHSVLQHYPFRAKLKYILGKINPALLNILSDNDGVSKSIVSGTQYELIRRRAQNIPTEIIQNSLSHPSNPDFECLKHNINELPVKPKVAGLKIKVGTDQCSQPYMLNLLNIGPLNQKVLKNASVLALSEGANIQGCAVNTGREGISPHLIRGGSDLIWQIAHEDYAFRNGDGSFNEKLYQDTANRPYVKMIEVVLPRQEISIMKRLARDRMIIFLNRLRYLSNGKPIGIRLFNPGKEVLTCICDSMISARLYLDFITIDNTVSINGFDSINVSNANAPLHFKAITNLRKTIESKGIPTKILVSGGIISEYDILRSIALGADACWCIAPMIFAIGSSSRFKFTNPFEERLRVANFHRNTIEATIKLMELCSYRTLEDVNAEHFFQKTSFLEMKSLKEIYLNECPAKGSNLFSSLS